jgi:hypothetical protein
MLLILLSWLYIAFTTINFGVLTDRIIVLKNKNFAITSFLGLFSITILASIWAVFGRINIEFHLLLLLSNLIIFYKFKNSIVTICITFWHNIIQLSWGFKIYLLIISILILAQCSKLPYVIDNESYYIQTIKWINEYGFVKGIANLHLYLGQSSGWHVAQSVFNFSFLYERFNDLSGFCLILSVFFSVEKLDLYYKNNNFNYLFIGVFPLASSFLFQFISAPSPDIPIYVLTFIILFYFLENFRNCTSEQFNLIVILILFMLYIKSTSLVFVLLIPALLLQNRRFLHKKLLVPGAITFVVLVLFVTKNMIVSGSVFFPSTLLEPFAMNYSIPKAIESDYYKMIKYYGYNVTQAQFQAMSFTELLKNWLSMPKINGIFNKLSLVLVAIVTFFIFKYQNKKSFWLIYILMVLQLILLFSTSPQFRFFTNFILFFGLFFVICIFRNKTVITSSLLLSIIPVFITVLFPLQLKVLTNNKFMSQTDSFPVKAIIFPLENTKINTTFDVFEIGNLKYNSPVENDFFYGTGNGDLPCVNKKQIDYYEKHFKIIPQLRTNDLKDGFYSKKIVTDE